MSSPLRQRGFDPSNSLVLHEPRAGEQTLRSSDTMAAIQEHGDELALIMLAGVQYYTRQVLPMAVLPTTTFPHYSSTERTAP